MAFNAKGYLDAGLHLMEQSAIENAFVIAFPHSSTRRTIIEGYKKHFSEIHSLVAIFQQFIDGSFVSNKNDPADIDLVCFIDADMVDSLPLAEQQKLAALFAPSARGTYLCDAYFSPTYPANHPRFARARTQRKYWMGEFGFDRQDVPKGIVYVDAQPAPAAASKVSP